MSIPRLLPVALTLLAAVGLVGSVVAQDASASLRVRLTPTVVVARDACPAVVYIQTGGVTTSQNIWGQLTTQQFSGSGTGVVVNKEGFVITNYHVVKGARQITVSFDKQYDPVPYPAQLVSFVEGEDLALLKIDGDKDFHTIPLGTSSDLMLGETVIAIGNPYGQTHTVTQGIISGLHRNVQIPSAGLVFDDLIQTDTGINLGNSGGPLLNVLGELIGINSAMNHQAQNIGFAIPVDRVKQVLDDQLWALQSASAWLGFDVDPEDEHLRVKEVVPGSPASLAGLQAGDCIVALGGSNIASQEEYRLARISLTPSREVVMKVERDGSSRPLRVTPWERADGILYAQLGLRVGTRENGLNRPVFVADLRPDGPAAKLGLRRGDQIDAMRLNVGGRQRSWRIDTRETFANLVQQLEPGTQVELAVYREVDGDGRLTRADEHRGVIVVE